MSKVKYFGPLAKLFEVGATRWEKELANVFRASEGVADPDSDVAAVLVGVSLFSSSLEMLLKHAFIALSGASESECDRFLAEGPVPPLQGTWKQAKVAFFMGLIDRWLLCAIEEANSIRNKYAHQLCPIQLDEETVDRVVRHLPDICHEPFEKYIRESGIESVPRARFIAACLTIHFLLFSQAERSFGDKVPGEKRYEENQKDGS